MAGLLDLAPAVPALVALVSAAIAGAALRARKRTGNGAIGFVTAAFGVLALKSTVKAWHLSFGPESMGWEMAFSVADLLVVFLIALPMFRAWGRRSL